MITRPLGFDAGMRTLERTIQGVVRKVAKSIVEGKGDKFRITTENIREFIPH
jgi:ATP-dependent Lon protease